MEKLTLSNSAFERVYRNEELKAQLGDGPWQQEPDKIQWVDSATNLDCLMVRNRMGCWCGYVGIPESHSLFGQGYDDVDVEAHGGLTFADTCDEEGPEHASICHVPFPGRTALIWWLGFDCAHAGDLTPINHHFWQGDAYRDEAYVRAECAHLAAQLKEIS